MPERTEALAFKQGNIETVALLAEAAIAWMRADDREGSTGFAAADEGRSGFEFYDAGHQARAISIFMANRTFGSSRGL